jgi:molecular chaperone GrpE
MAESENRAAIDQGIAGVAETRAPEPETLDLLVRERTAFRNYRRRVEREREGDRELARADLLRRLLPLLDDLDRATAHRPPDLESHAWAEGVVLIGRRLADLFRDLGVERIGVEGEPFDPYVHEAVFYDRHPDVTGQTVARVIKAGYRQGDRLLRPASVAVVGPIG